MSMEKALQILDKAHSGPVCSVDDWDYKIIPKAVNEKLKKFGLVKTFDKDNPINFDDSLADEFFKAGFELAVELGMICQDTERIIKITEDELNASLHNSLKELPWGSGRDMVVMRPRKVEDPKPPLVASPTGLAISEEFWVRLHEGIAQNAEIDILCGGSLLTILGRYALAGTPYETLLGRYQAQLTKEVLWRVGRPGMASIGVVSSPTVFGQLGGFGVAGGFDPATNMPQILTPGEMMTNYTTLHKVVHALNCGAKVRVAFGSIIGGYSGPPEGTALTRVASYLLQYPVHLVTVSGADLVDVRYGGSCGREGIWVMSIACQAMSRNTQTLRYEVPCQVAGPSTAMLLYESAVAMINLAASGTSAVTIPRTSAVKYIDHVSPLECKFCAEVIKRSAGISRKRANEIAKSLIPKYEASLWDPPKGKRFQDCFDLKQLKPTQEWQDIYLKIKKELIDLGIQLSL